MLKAACAVAAVVASANCAVAGFVNATVSAQYYFPTATTPYGTPKTAIVGNGVEFTALIPDLSFQINVSDTSVSAGSFSCTGAFTTAAFNGFTLTFAGLTTPITAVSVDAATTMSGFTASRVSFTANQVSVNWQGLCFVPATVVKVNTTFAKPPAAPAAVIAPLPAPLACGLAMLGGVALRKRRRN